MKNSNFRVRVFEAPRQIVVLFARTSRNLTERQIVRILQKTGGAA